MKEYTTIRDYFFYVKYVQSSPCISPLILCLSFSSSPGVPGETGLDGEGGHTGKMGPIGDMGKTKEIHFNLQLMFLCVSRTAYRNQMREAESFQPSVSRERVVNNGRQKGSKINVAVRFCRILMTLYSNCLKEEI